MNQEIADLVKRTTALLEAIDHMLEDSESHPNRLCKGYAQTLQYHRIEARAALIKVSPDSAERR